MNLSHYKSLVFDCDGVVLDSNVVKTEAYFRTAKNLGATDVQAQALVDYHIELGGISRYHKFNYYLKNTFIYLAYIINNIAKHQLTPKLKFLKNWNKNLIVYKLIII